MLGGPLLVRGTRLRDEFACPITRELMREPVIAADGHTYDKEAIEMWLRHHDTSPKTGQPMDHLFVVPNHNLKRLIKDLIAEKGEGLYVHDATEEDDKEEDNDELENREDGGRAGGRRGEGRYRFALVTEHILVLKCLGPVDSDWNGKSFRVTQRGCIGGRKQPAHLGGADFMQFSDATVSRRHFEIVFNKQDKCFSLMDYGSAGGTFVRVPSGVPTPLYPSMMIMLGKHQLEVSPADRMEGDLEGVRDATVPKGMEGRGSDSSDNGDRKSRRVGSVSRCPSPPHGLDMVGGEGGREEKGMDVVGRGVVGGLESFMTPLEVGLADLHLEDAVGNRGNLGGGGDRMLFDRRSDGSRSPPGPGGKGRTRVATGGGEDDASLLETPLENKGLMGGEDDGVTDDDEEAKSLERSFEAGAKLAKGHRRVILKCFAPEGTPIQGCEFFVGREGATLGRKQTNTIAFSHEVNGTVMGIDSSISGEHARITYDEGGDFLHIMDGTPAKPSTNGTWFRLSGMHRSSKPYLLGNGAEILVGTVRFSVTLETMVVERELTPENRAKYIAEYEESKGL